MTPLKGEGGTGRAFGGLPACLVIRRAFVPEWDAGEVVQLLPPPPRRLSSTPALEAGLGDRTEKAKLLPTKPGGAGAQAPQATEGGAKRQHL